LYAISDRLRGQQPSGLAHNWQPLRQTMILPDSAWCRQIRSRRPARTPFFY